MIKNQLAVAVDHTLHTEPVTQRPGLAAPAGAAGPGLPDTEAAPSACWVGIDVAKAHLDVAIWPTQERLRVTLDEAGMTELMAWLRPQAP